MRNTLGSRRARRAFAVIAGAAILGFGSSATRGADSGTEEAIAQSGREFASIKSSAKDAAEQLDSALTGLRELEGRLKLTETGNLLSKEKKAALLDTIKKSRLQIARSRKILADFQGKAGVVTDAFDAYDAMVKFRDEYRAYQSGQGQLAADLYALGTAMEKLGKDVPLLGDMIESYGKLTTGMLTKIAAVSKTIDEMRNQGAISGPGYYKTGKDLTKYNALKAKYPTLAERAIYFPASPSFVYVAEKNDPQLIWDAEAGDFYLAAKEVPLNRIFQMNLLAARQRRTASELKHIADRWNSYYSPLEETAKLLPALVDALGSGQAFDALMEIENKHQNIFASVADADLFQAKYLFDPGIPNTREQIRVALAELYALFRTKGLNGAAGKLKAFADKHKIDLTVGALPKNATPTGAQMTYGHFEDPLARLTPAGGPCAFKQEYANNSETEDDISWYANCLSARGDQLHSMRITVKRFRPGKHCNTPQLLAGCQSEANASAFQGLVNHYDESRGLGSGDTANKQLWAVTTADAKWPDFIVTKGASTYSYTLSLPDLARQLKDNYYYTEFDTREINKPAHSAQARNAFAVQAGNVYIFGSDTAYKIPPDRVRPIIAAMLAKLPLNAGKTPPASSPPKIGPGNIAQEKDQSRSPRDNQGPASSPNSASAPQQQVPAPGPRPADAAPEPPRQIQEALDAANKLNSLFRGLLK